MKLPERQSRSVRGAPVLYAAIYVPYLTDVLVDEQKSRSACINFPQRKFHWQRIRGTQRRSTDVIGK